MFYTANPTSQKSTVTLGPRPWDETSAGVLDAMLTAESLRVNLSADLETKVYRSYAVTLKRWADNLGQALRDRNLAAGKVPGAPAMDITIEITRRSGDAWSPIWVTITQEFDHKRYSRVWTSAIEDVPFEFLSAYRSLQGDEAAFLLIADALPESH